MALEYHKQVVSAMLEDDNCLLVMGKGMGLDVIVQSFVRLHSHPATLVLVLGVFSGDEERLVESVRGHVDLLPRVITYDTPQKDREALYLGGGVLLVTPRILVVDWLQKRIPAHLVQGILVCNAHTVHDHSNEAWVVRLFRESNGSKGWVKAFTDAANRLQRGWARVEKTMRALFVSKLHLWPRFRLEVTECLERHAPEVVEVYPALTQLMRVVQSSIVEVMDACIRELRSTNHVDLSEVTVESALFTSFDRLIREQLEQAWHNVGFRAKQLTADLRTLRQVAINLLHYDSVTFLSFLEMLRHHSTTMAERALWHGLPGADMIFKMARRRVYKVVAAKEGEAASGAAEHVFGGTQISMVLEENPKWQLVTEILAEIEAEVDSRGDDARASVLIMCDNMRTCRQLSEHICDGGYCMLSRLFDRYARLAFTRCSKADGPYGHMRANASALGLQEKERQLLWMAGSRVDSQRQQPRHGRTPRASPTSQATLHRFASNPHAVAPPPPPPLPTTKAKPRADAVPATATTLGAFPPSFPSRPDNTPFMAAAAAMSALPTDMQYASGAAAAPVPPVHVVPSDDSDGEGGGLPVLAPKVQVVVHPHNGHARVLDDTEPTYVIVYDADLSFLRRVEQYKAARPGKPVRVYMLMYKESIEQQRFLSELSREKDAFEALIRTKANMVVNEDLTPEVPRNPDEVEESPFSSPSKRRRGGGGSSSSGGGGSSRQGGKRASTEPQVVIVDMREFRSSLPFMMHVRGIKVVPVTLEVGDYILTPDICVERKAINDLRESMKSGRLHTQAEAMCRHYSVPVLLIEFDAHKEFALQAKYEYSGDPDIRSIGSKLALLILHFPQLRIVWSRSPADSARIVAQLKRGRDQPNAVDAAAMGVDGSAQQDKDAVYDFAAVDVLKALPGITQRNYHLVMNKVASVHELCALSRDEMTTLLGTTAGEQLFSFLHRQVADGSDLSKRPLSKAARRKANAKKRRTKAKST